MMKGFRVRLLPTEEQESLLLRNAGAARFAWNWGLGLQMKRFEDGEKLLGKNDLRTEFLKLKKQDDYSWLVTIQSPCGFSS